MAAGDLFLNIYRYLRYVGISNTRDENRDRTDRSRIIIIIYIINAIYIILLLLLLLSS